MQDARLESWKEIATHLNRGIRTVQRWEKQEGLPVHRHAHEKLGSVYAYRQEIDAWLSSRSSQAEETGSAAPSPPDREPRAPFKWRYAVVVGGVLSVAALLAAFMLDRKDSTALFTPVPVTTLPGSELFPAVSPDGSSVAFTWAAPGQPLNIYVRKIGTESQYRLTDTNKVDLGASWSPDGRRIAFLRGNPVESPRGEVMIANASGGNERKVAETEKDWGPLFAWTPDSKGLLFADCHPPNPCVIQLVWLESGHRQELTAPAPKTPGDTSPAVAPDGSGLLFLRRSGATTTVHLQKLSRNWTPEGTPVQLTPGTAFASAPAWAADGRSVFYLTGQEGVGMKLWRKRPIAGASPTLIALLGDSVYESGITVAGNHVITQDMRFDFNIHRLGLKGPKENQRLTDSNRSDTFPHYSPDGAHVVFQSNRKGGSDLFVMNADGTGTSQVTFFGARRAETPRWSPDGKRIVFAANVSPGDVYIVSSSGGTPSLVLGGPENDYLPSWSPDGEWIYFTSTRSGREEVWKVKHEGGAPVQVTAGGGCRPLASPDGRFMYFTRRLREAAQTGTLWRIAVNGSKEEQVTDTLIVRPENLDIDGKLLYFSGVRGGGEKGIRVFDTATGEERLLSNIGSRSPGKGLAIAPGGGAVLYSQLDYHDADLVMFHVP